MTLLVVGSHVPQMLHVWIAQNMVLLAISD